MALFILTSGMGDNSSLNDVNIVASESESVSVEAREISSKKVTMTIPKKGIKVIDAKTGIVVADNNIKIEVD